MIDFEVDSRKNGVMAFKRMKFIRVNHNGRLFFSMSLIDMLDISSGDKLKFVKTSEEPNGLYVGQCKGSEKGFLCTSDKKCKDENTSRIRVNSRSLVTHIENLVKKAGFDTDYYSSIRLLVGQKPMIYRDGFGYRSYYPIIIKSASILYMNHVKENLQKYADEKNAGVREGALIELAPL